MTQQYTELNTGAKETQQVKTGGPDNNQSIWPLPSHQYINIKVGTVMESEVQPTGVLIKRKAKLPTVIGLIPKHTVCCNILMLQYIFQQ